MDRGDDSISLLSEQTGDIEETKEAALLSYKISVSAALVVQCSKIRTLGSVSLYRLNYNFFDR